MTVQTKLPGDLEFERQSGFGAVYQVLREAIDRRAFPGCAFGVLREGQVLLQDALGRFTYDQDAATMGAETVFDIASLTKVVSTTAAAMLLYQRGLLDLEMPLGKLLPGFVTTRAAVVGHRAVTLRHLLAHSSGLPGYVEFFRQTTMPAGLYRRCLQLPLEAPPGERAEYSDPGFILLGRALEALINEPLVPWVQREIFKPLGLDLTGFCPSPTLQASIPPTEIDSKLRHRRIQGEVQDENAWILQGAAGHAGLFSNVPDLLRFSRVVLAAFSRPGDGLLFAPSTVQQFALRQGPEGSSRALGWDTPSSPSSSGHYFSARSIGHLGYSGCSLWIDPDAHLAVVLLTNRTWPDRSSQLIREVRPAFHDAVRVAIGESCIKGGIGLALGSDDGAENSLSI